MRHTADTRGKFGGRKLIFEINMDRERNKIKKYIVHMTEEQREITEGIFNFHGWDITVQCAGDCESENDNFSSSEERQTSLYEDEQKIRKQTYNSETVRTEESIAVLTENEQNVCIAAEQDGDSRCISCLNNPCVTTNPQSWLGNGRPARVGNNTIRKRLYRKYWTMLDRRGLWYFPEYLDRKEQAMKEAKVQLTQREIMPDCVLKQVRNLYPNPKGVTYMGHNW